MRNFAKAQQNGANLDVASNKIYIFKSMAKYAISLTTQIAILSRNMYAVVHTSLLFDFNNNNKLHENVEILQL